jgi:hypothetical protein
VEFGVVAVVLPAVQEPAHDLEIAGLVVPVAIEAVERGEELLVVMVAIELKADPSQRAQPVLCLQERDNVLLQLALVGEAHLLQLHGGCARGQPL